MAVVKYPERVLIVLNEDGSFKAAHSEDLIVEDGIPIRSEGAKGLNAASLQLVLPDTAMLLEQVQTLEADKALATEALDALRSENEQTQLALITATERGNTLATQLTTANDELIVLRQFKLNAESTLAEAAAQIAVLNTKIQDLELALARFTDA